MIGYRIVMALAIVLAFGVVADRNTARADPSVLGIAIVATGLTTYGLIRDRAPPQGPSRIALGAGSFDIIDGDDRAIAFRTEYRPAYTFARFSPIVGIEATTDGGFYGYAGARMDVDLGRNFVASPNFAVVGYQEGDGKDLGSAIQFRSGIDLFVEFSGSARLGVSFHHLSNGQIFGDTNPGTETLLLTYAIPLARIL